MEPSIEVTVRAQVVVVSKKDMQRTAPEDCQRKIYEELKEVEEKRAKEALVLVQKKHKLIKDWRWQVQRVHGLECSSIGSCSSSFAPNTDEAMSASSRMALEVDKAISEESWNALAKEKEEDLWSIDLGSEQEELEEGSR